MQIKRLIVGALETNCYILEQNNMVLIIDPGDEFELINSEISNKKVIGILITHYHFDHIGALEKLKNKYDVPIYDYHILDGKKINIENFNFILLHTPGHTSDSVTFHFINDNIMFTGDFIFRESIGRTDLATGNMSVMMMSIDRIKHHKDTKIYPGHGDSTTLDYEKKHNIYFHNMY